MAHCKLWSSGSSDIHNGTRVNFDYPQENQFSRVQLIPWLL